MGDEATGGGPAGEAVTARPEEACERGRGRRTLAELLVWSELLPALYEDTRGCLDGPPVGAEGG